MYIRRNHWMNANILTDQISKCWRNNSLIWFRFIWVWVRTMHDRNRSKRKQNIFKLYASKQSKLWASENTFGDMDRGHNVCQTGLNLCIALIEMFHNGTQNRSKSMWRLLFYLNFLNHLSVIFFCLSKCFLCHMPHWHNGVLKLDSSIWKRIKTMK